MKFFSLIEGDNVHIAPDVKVVPGKEFSKLVNAQELTRQVKKEETAYRKSVSIECETLKEAAELAGFEEGLKQWNQHIAQLEDQIKKVRQEMEKTLVPLALTAVKKLIGRELETEPDTIIDIITTALKTVTQHKKIALYVHKGDLDRVEGERSRIRQLFEHLESLSISARGDIQPGGCIIETESGIINAQLESQLKALETAFRSFFQNHQGGSQT